MDFKIQRPRIITVEQQLLTKTNLAMAIL